MKNFISTNHLIKRESLRGFQSGDVDYILNHGKQIQNSICMLSSLCRDLVDKHKKEIKRIERLKGKTVIVEGGIAITTFHMNRNKLKSILKRR